ncbi:hypothetical protein VL01_03410 [Aeromonas enteropelogenes]|nr:hypothetical protein VL01_03410 [Aeromonas enteropelogenes]
MGQWFLFDLAIQPAIQRFTSPFAITHNAQFFSNLLLVIDFEDSLHQASIFGLALGIKCLIFFRGAVNR